MAEFKFKKTHSLEDRIKESSRVLSRHKDHVPVIVEVLEKITIPSLDKAKYLAPSELTMGEFLSTMRKRLKINEEQAVFLFINNELPPLFNTMGQLYSMYKDEDGFLYIKIYGETTFG